MISITFVSEIQIGDKVKHKAQPELKFIVEGFEILSMTENKINFYRVIVNDGYKTRKMNPLTLEIDNETSPA